jgi:hypothetical protein
VDAGPIQIEGTTPETIQISPIFSVAALVAGILVLLIW